MESVEQNAPTVWIQNALQENTVLQDWEPVLLLQQQLTLELLKIYSDVVPIGPMLMENVVLTAQQVQTLHALQVNIASLSQMVV